MRSVAGKPLELRPRGRPGDATRWYSRASTVVLAEGAPTMKQGLCRFLPTLCLILPAP